MWRAVKTNPAHDITTQRKQEQVIRPETRQLHSTHIKILPSVMKEDINFIHVHCRGHQNIKHVYLLLFWETQETNREKS